MAQLSNSPKGLRVITLEARKSYAFGMYFTEGEDNSILDMTGMELRLVIKQKPRQGGAIVVSQVADPVAAAVGLMQFNLQAVDLDLPAREYDFSITLKSVIDYTTLIIKGIIDLRANADDDDSGLYAGVNPSESFVVNMDNSNVVAVHIGHVDGFRLQVDQAIADFTAEVQGLLDAALLEADVYISEASTAAVSAAASAVSAAASADAALAIVEAAIDFDPLSLVPSGAGMEWYDEVAPAGWLMQQGQAISRTVYSGIFDKLGTKFGIGNGVTTFNLPDRRKRVAVGADTGDPEYDGVGTVGGSETGALVEANLPPHQHSMAHNHAMAHSHVMTHGHAALSGSAGAHNHTAEVGHKETGEPVDWSYVDGAGRAFNVDGTATTNTEPAHNHTVQVTDFTGSTAGSSAPNTAGSSAPNTGNGAGTGAGFDIVQPYIVVNYIIKI